MQVGEEPAVGEFRGDLVGHVDGRGGLTAPRFTDDGDDGYREGGPAAGRHQEFADVGDEALAPGEVGDGSGQHLRHLGDGSRTITTGGRGPVLREVEPGVRREDGVLELSQPDVGFHTELVEHESSGVAVDVEGLRLAPGAVEAQHELAAQPLTERELLYEAEEFTDDHSVPAEGEFELDVLLGDGDPLLGEPVGAGLDHLAGHSPEGRTAPQPKRLPICGRRLLPLPNVAQLARLRDE